MAGGAAEEGAARDAGADPADPFSQEGKRMTERTPADEARFVETPSNEQWDPHCLVRCPCCHNQYETDDVPMPFTPEEWHWWEGCREALADVTDPRVALKATREVLNGIIRYLQAINLASGQHHLEKARETLALLGKGES